MEAVDKGVTMLSHTSVSAEIIGFITKRLLDLSQANQKNCKETLADTDISQDTLSVLGWLKFDRIVSIGPEYVARKEIDELIRIDKDLLTSIVAEVSEAELYTTDETPGAVCLNSQPHQGYKAQIYGTMKAFIASSVTEMRNGKNLERRGIAHSVGIDKVTVWSFARLHSYQCWKVAQLYAERVFYKDFFVLNQKCLSTLTASALSQAKEEEMLEKYILFGATQRHIKEMLGSHIRNTRISERKRFLEYQNRKEKMRETRYSVLTPRQRDKVYEVWINNLHLSLLERFVVVAKETRIKIWAINRIVSEVEPTAANRCA